jgi:hypothetical protein
MSTNILLKIMTLAPSTNIGFPDKLFVVVEGAFLCVRPIKFEGHRIDPWKVLYINLLRLVKKLLYSLDDFISNFFLSRPLSLSLSLCLLIMI